MPEDEETPGAPGWFADGILENGQDPGAVRRATIRETNARRQQNEADRAAQRGQERKERGGPGRHRGMYCPQNGTGSWRRCLLRGWLGCWKYCKSGIVLIPGCVNTVEAR